MAKKIEKLSFEAGNLEVKVSVYSIGLECPACGTKQYFGRHCGEAIPQSGVCVICGDTLLLDYEGIRERLKEVEDVGSKTKQ